MRRSVIIKMSQLENNKYIIGNTFLYIENLKNTKFPAIPDVIKFNNLMFAFEHFQTILDKTIDYTLVNCSCLTLQTKKPSLFTHQLPPSPPPIQC